MKEKFEVTGMTCSACSATVEKHIKKLEGVDSVNVNLLGNSMIVSFDEKKLNEDKIIETVKNAGYSASLPSTKPTTDNNDSSLRSENLVEKELKEMKTRLILSILFTVPLFYLSMGHMFNWPLPKFFLDHKNALAFAFTQFLLCIPVVYVNMKFFKIGFKSLFKGSPNMDSLIAIGSSAALAYSIASIYKVGYSLGQNNIHMAHTNSMDLYFESAAMILALITLGKFMETNAKGKTSEAITKLINLRPKTALVKRDGIETEIPIENVIKGDIVIVKPGQTIPVDGIITKGSSSVDESAITGESIPVEKQEGSKVVGASINKSGYFEFEALQVGDDTTLSQIIRLIEEASSSKAPIAKLADKISGVFVPIVITIAVLSTLIWLMLGHTFQFSLSIGIAVLVISCPCALGLATPTAIMVGTGKGAQSGILIKSAEILETAHKIDTIVLDKTGTITEGKPKVTDIIFNKDISSSEMNEKNLLKIAASIEKLSEHPLADAILEDAKNKNIDLYDVKDFKTIQGQGLKASMNNTVILAGNLKLMRENNILTKSKNINFEEIADSLALEGKTPLYFSDSEKVIGLIAVADVIKSSSKRAIAELQSMGMDVIMLTGDNKKTALAIQKQLNIKNAIAEVLPQDKESHVRKLQDMGKKVAMVGDGINDAPALARADVGVAIGAGTDIAIESADIILVKNDLLDVATMVQLSNSVIRNIRENLFWALIYNVIGIPLAAGVFYSFLGWKLNPMFAAAAMSLSSVCVVSNALRLKFFKPHFKTIDTEKNIVFNDKNKVTLEVINEDLKEKGDLKMEKIMKIDGMMCAHCSSRVEKVLNEIDGVTATVNLQEKTATLSLSKDVDNEILTKAITDAGYTVLEIQ